MKKIDFYIKKYLEARPFFYVFIRPEEALLFEKYQALTKTPSLDFGCGDGFFAKTAFADQKITVGLDLKNSRINQAKNVYKKLTIYNGKKIPYPDGYFASVVSNCVLEHLPNLNLSLHEIYRVLRPGGYFITTVMTDRWEDYIFAKKIMRKIQKHLNLPSAKKWKNIFQKKGFEIEKEIGYLSPKSAKYNEFSHYLSFPSLLSYKLFGKWVLWPKLFCSTHIIDAIKKNINCPVDISESAAVFFVLKKFK